MRDNARGADLAKAFMYVVLGTTLAFTVASVWLIVESGEQNEIIIPDFDSPLGIAYLSSAMAFTISYVSSAVFFVLWFHRSYSNLEILDARNVSHPTAQAAWTWFVPIMNLFRPRTIMAEIWDQYQYYAFKVSPDLKDTAPNRGLLSAWWALWIGSSILSQMETRLADRVASADQFIGVEMLGLVVQVMSIGAGLIVIKLIDSLKAYEEVAYEHQDDIIDGKGLFDTVL